MTHLAIDFMVTTLLWKNSTSSNKKLAYFPIFCKGTAVQFDIMRMLFQIHNQMLTGNKCLK